MSQDQNKSLYVSKKIIAITALVLSVCVAVYAFWIFNEIERRMANRDRQKEESAVPVSAYDSTTGDGSGIINDEITSIITDDDADVDIDQLTVRDIRQSQSGDHHRSVFPGLEPGATNMASLRDAEKRLEPLQKRDQLSLFGLPYTVNNGCVNKKLIAFTFDGGSNNNAALDIMDTLASRGVKSTMFLTGSFIRRFPQTVTRLADEGHELANHTMTHPRMTSFAETKRHTTRSEITRQTVINELTRTERVLAERTGLRFAPLWRSPYGEYNNEICRWALEAGYLHIGWRKGRTWQENLDSNDWVTDTNSPSFKTPDEVFYKIINMAKKPQGVNGGIVLMHLGTERRERSMQAHLILGKLIDELREMGYEAVTVSELLYQSEIDISGLISQKEQLTYRD